jgi:aspartate 1-decarboxylase
MDERTPRKALAPQPVLRQLLKSKLHRAIVTEANPDYIGSVTIDRNLIEAVDLWPGELVHVWNLSNGERLETYVLGGERGSGIICLNGAAALRVTVGDTVIIASFALSATPIEPQIVLLDEQNRIVRRIDSQTDYSLAALKQRVGS